MTMDAAMTTREPNRETAAPAGMLKNVAPMSSPATMIPTCEGLQPREAACTRKPPVCQKRTWNHEQLAGGGGGGVGRTYV